MLTNNDSVWTVGNNAYGQCGRPVIPDEDYTRQAVYHRLKALDGISVKQVECGQDTSFFLSEEGAVYSCGWGADGQTGRGHYNNEPAVGAVIGDIVGEKIVKVSCRADCALALNEEGQVYSWGFGPIGKGPNVTYSKLPTPIPSTLFGQNEITPDAKVTSVTCGINQFAVINSQGSLFTWGKNPGGCLGQRHKKDQYFPLHVCIGGQVMKVSCGVDHMAAMVKEIV
ncbi:Williams-Beuren syndrome chromosomal region 16 protein [Portunus trituberculatus]|uniref:Williams-Beuren syndrome chromosomal region 16 protein n=1 Tax=Portunus trituberculatus TaxID=210409 RepID=A0A5B7E361_PORTR|nr:Williams-Beuren syndrome chromosomal region 16 protein [Portunus trituberculatus]